MLKVYCPICSKTHFIMPTMEEDEESIVYCSPECEPGPSNNALGGLETSGLLQGAASPRGRGYPLFQD